MNADSVPEDSVSDHRRAWSRRFLGLGVAFQVLLLLLAVAGGKEVVPLAHGAKQARKSANDDLVREAENLLRDPVAKRPRKTRKKTPNSTLAAAAEETSASPQSKLPASRPDSVNAPGNGATNASPLPALPTKPVALVRPTVPASSASNTNPEASTAGSTQSAILPIPATPTAAPTLIGNPPTLTTPISDAGLLLPSPDLNAPIAQPLDAGASLDQAYAAAQLVVQSPPAQLPPPESVIAAASAQSTSPANPSSRLRISSRNQRISSGKNYPMQGVPQSPLAKIGIPAAAVPAVATLLTASVIAFWPFLLKTLTMLLKAVITGRLKVRAKKDKKLDTSQRQFVVFGFPLRPLELGAVLVGAVVYGLAICYTLKGWKLDSPFLLGQEAIVLAIYYLRSFIRLAFERFFGLATQFRFWLVGGLLCLFSAFLGSPLATVGYELESAKGPQAAEQAARLKVALLVATLCLAVGFFAANLLFPHKLLQSGRLITSGMALAEVLPITPMPGLKIYQWRKGVWALLFVLVVPTYFLINFFL